MIIYIHGFASSGNSSKVDLLRQCVASADQNIDVLAPTYTSDDPNIAISELTEYIKQAIANAPKDEELMLIGTSLGAYYARYLAEQFHAKAVLINPVFKPEQMLQMVGTHTHFKTGEQFSIGGTFITELVRYYVFKAHMPTLVLLDQDDEVLDNDEETEFFENNANVVTYLGGSHRFDHLEESFRLILHHYNARMP